jgi:ankyrin repeat protein
MMGLLTDAVHNRDLQTVQSLLAGDYEFDRRINEERDKEGNCALIIAAKLGLTEMITPLLQAEANINQSGREGITALHAAADQNHLEVLAILLKHPTMVPNKLDSQGCTPLHIVAQKGLIEGAQLLIEAKALVNKADKNGQTPLDMAAEQGHEMLVALLIESGASIDASGRPAWTPLHYAAKANAVAAMQVLIDAHAPIDAIDRDSNTALHIAAEANSLEAASLLLDHGADARALSDQDRTPLDIAKQCKHQAMIDLLKTHLRAHPPTAEQAQLLSGSDAEDNLHIDLGALVSELPVLMAGFGNAQIRAAQGQGEASDFEMPAAWGETLSSTGALLQRQTAGIQAQRPPMQAGARDQEPAATAMLHLFASMGTAMQQTSAAGRGSRQRQASQPSVFNPFAAFSKPPL